MHRTRIKICGLTRPADVDAAVAAGADALGFVLWPGSARAVSLARAAELAARMAAGFDLLDFARQYTDAQGLLLDAHVEGYGGAGKVFDWSLLEHQLSSGSRVRLPLVLSGGLGPANVAEGVRRLRPWAVDVSSGVEQFKGVKDAALMQRFCEVVRAADAAMAATAS